VARRGRRPAAAVAASDTDTEGSED
jgi:hypothetical protein